MYSNLSIAVDVSLYHHRLCAVIELRYLPVFYYITEEGEFEHGSIVIEGVFF